MYSIYDSGLPFGTNTDYHRGFRLIETPKKQKSMSGIEIDLWYMRDRVRTAYKDLIINF